MNNEGRDINEQRQDQGQQELSQQGGPRPQEERAGENNPPLREVMSRSETPSPQQRVASRGLGTSPTSGYPVYDRYTPQKEYSGGNNYTGLFAALAGVGAGIAAMYYFDPDRGRRRRALIADKVKSTTNKLPDAMAVTARDVSNRAKGAWAEATKLFSSEDPSDQIVEARVRAKLGRVVSHPHSVHVSARDGHVTLDGVILKREVPALLSAIGSVRGVRGVESKLQEFDSPEGVPSLQGGRQRESRSEFMQQNWSPAARLAAGTAGTAALAYGIAKHKPLSLGLGAAGAALLARSVTNTELQRLIGFGGGRTAVTIDKAINVNAPVDVLFNLWSNFENFPRFMTNVLEVRNINDRTSHWKVAGPAGVPVEWDAEITKVVPNEMIAWKSVEGSPVANAGYVLFEPNDDGTTEVSVRLSYNPPAGAIGHAVAKAFGADPKASMDDDLMRMKSLLETGQPPRDAAQAQHGQQNPQGGIIH